MQTAFLYVYTYRPACCSSTGSCYCKGLNECAALQIYWINCCDIIIIINIVAQFALQQVNSLFQNYFSTECLSKLLLYRVPFSALPWNFRYLLSSLRSSSSSSHLLLVVPSLLPFLHLRALEGS
jgi:hypothetical protein